jgi:hypothetical protein
MVVKKIDIAVLREACERIFEFIKNDLKISSIDLEEDLYWALPEDVRYDITAAPTASHAGNLFDDYDFVSPLINDRGQAMPLMFMHIAPLLNALAYRLPSHT